MGRKITITMELLFKLAKDEKFQKLFPVLANKIMALHKFAVEAFKKEEAGSTNAAAAVNFGFNQVKKHLLKLKPVAIKVIKEILDAEQLFVRYTDDFGNNKSVYL